MSEVIPVKLKTDGSTKKIQEFETGDTLPASMIPSLSGTYLTGVVEDTSPQLGGDLDLNSHGLSTNADIPKLRKRLHVIVLKPSTIITINTVVPLMVTNAAITVESIEARTSTASYEIAGDLKWADARIGLANATVIDTFDTTSGVRSDSSVAAPSVASGKFVYLQFDSAPNAAIDDIFIDITYVY